MSIVQLPTSPAESLRFPVDAEHGGIRLVVLVAFIAAWVTGFMLVSVLIVSQGLNLLAIGGGFGLGALVAIPLERYLKGRWKSGRAVVINPDRVQVEKKGILENEISVEESAQILFWRFEIQRRTRVPKGWSMLGCAISADGRYLTAYTFVSPDMLEKLPKNDRFKKLASRKEREKSGDVKGEMRLAGEQRRLLEAEHHRWMEGAEMTPQLFETFVSSLETRFPEWMPV